MKIRNLVLGALCGITFFSCSASGGGKDAEMDRFITDLMGKMTIREKLGQLNLPSFRWRFGDRLCDEYRAWRYDSQRGNRWLLQCERG